MELAPNTQDDVLVSISRLSVRFDGEFVLENIDLTLYRHQILTLIGPNGSGKSTLVKTLIGAVKPAAGSLRVGAGLRIGYVPQRLHLDPTLPMTVKRFINLPHRQDPAAVERALDEAGAGHLLQATMSHLSGGQFQRVLLARALLTRPDILILDEATQGLDQRGTAEFYRRIEAVRQSYGCAVLMVSHDLNVVMRTADHVVCLNRTLCCEGKPEHVASSPDYQALFGEVLADDQGANPLALYRHHHEERANAG
ncbi:metal ABC transporter ATP-binding protein [Halomonas sp. HMF6819]|uniref:metal ABC transporter ATP-binding protein n=1 Tax=Halomonas sp. HMF6819 TaxID=3373085 RepID=UPI0037A9DCF5